MSSCPSGKPSTSTSSARRPSGRCGSTTAMMNTGSVRETEASSRRRQYASSAAACSAPADLRNPLYDYRV